MALVDPGGNGFAYTLTPHMARPLAQVQGRIRIQSTVFAPVPNNSFVLSYSPRIKIGQQDLAYEQNYLRQASLPSYKFLLIQRGIVIKLRRTTFTEVYGYASNFNISAALTNKPNSIFRRGFTTVSQKKLVVLMASELRTASSGQQSYQFWS